MWSGCHRGLDLLAQVAKFLTSQFYAINYSLRQRMDVLDVSAQSVPWPA